MIWAECFAEENRCRESDGSLSPEIRNPATIFERSHIFKKKTQLNVQRPRKSLKTIKSSEKFQLCPKVQREGTPIQKMVLNCEKERNERNFCAKYQKFLSNKYSSENLQSCMKSRYNCNHLGANNPQTMNSEKKLRKNSEKLKIEFEYKNHNNGKILKQSNETKTIDSIRSILMTEKENPQNSLLIQPGKKLKYDSKILKNLTSHDVQSIIDESNELNADSVLEQNFDAEIFLHRGNSMKTGLFVLKPVNNGESNTSEKKL